MVVKILGVLLIVFYSFINGAMFVIVEKRRHEEEIPFAEAWEKEIEESQNSKSGRFGMRFCYFMVEILVRLLPEKIYPISDKTTETEMVGEE